MKQALVIESQQMAVLFSYTTPVAFYDKLKGEVYKTNVHHSRTTSRHINEFFKKFIMPHTTVFETINIDQDKLNQMFPLSVTNL